MSQPNILFITTDQQHYSTLGTVNPAIRTPALDRLAREGTRFTRAYCPNPTCSPTRATLVTGMYPAWHGCWAIGVKLPEDVPTVGDLFQQHGYESILIGKAHFQPLASAPGSESIECQPLLRDLDFWRNFHGPWYGFNHVETARMHANESHAGQHYAIWMEEKGLTNWQDYFQKWPRDPNDKYSGPYYMRDSLTWDLPEEFHHSHWVGERTIAHMERCRQAGKPFYLWASFFDPHPPYVVPEPWASMYDPAEMKPGRYVEGEFDRMPPHFARTREAAPDFSDYQEPGGQGLHGFHSHLHTEEELQRSMAAYYGMISLIDQEIGRILEYLDQSGLAENTLVVFTTDHGHFLGQHGLIAKGAFHYEDLLRVPMIVRQPGQIPAGQVSDAIQSLVDFPQTFLAAAGIEAPGFMQGVNQLPVWQGKQATARDHALVENRHNPTTVHLRTLVTDRYKITVYRNADYGELFDLETDPGELHNRWDDPDYADVKAELLLKFVQAEIQREPTRMPRIAGA
ncbi:sulfatase-like hydrolase/transferase [Litorilinea aerophila]|uniref:Sulfatase-like hydrolase/transferase n=1 Tax=Litorilinea aerophila TaxID=1204385 RepID=A0A540VGU7_9CHLR|nr:sulfatase-like hydrolase/transferase [Litorilinea aerophila]MCC9076374.1 sulfatase-like hydrolase/transferase [Litorilinea aerophila]